MTLQLANKPGVGENSNLVNGPKDDELIRLNLVEWKRMRGGPKPYDIMDSAGGLITDSNVHNKNVTMEAALSDRD